MYTYIHICVYMYIYIYIYIYVYIYIVYQPEQVLSFVLHGILRSELRNPNISEKIYVSEFRDVVFEDMVFDNSSVYLILYLGVTLYGVAQLLLFNTTSSITTSLNSRCTLCPRDLGYKLRPLFVGVLLLLLY